LFVSTMPGAGSGLSLKPVINQEMNNENVQAFLEVLNLMYFDEILFRKEFGKTLKWIPEKEHFQVYKWMTSNNYKDKFPDLMSMLV